jgi:uncharacterized protein (DUF58 family)
MNASALAQLQSKVRRIEIISNRLVAERMAGQYHSVFKGQGMEFEEVRPYIAGDEIRSIDWNVTARSGAPHIKRFREERELNVFLVVDVSASCHFGTRLEFKSELMAELCAVLAFAAIANGDRIGLLLCSDCIELLLPPRKGRRHTLRLVREVLGFEPAGRGTDLGLALDHLRHVLHRRSVVFVVSDFITPGWEDALATAARRHDVIALCVEDAVEDELPDVGLLDVHDAETGSVRTLDTGSAAVRRAYREAQRRRRESSRLFFRRNGIDAVDIRTGAPYADALARFFRQRAKRARL